MSNTDLTIGERVYRYRCRRGLTQAVLAELVGRSERWLINVEGGKNTDLRVSDIVQLAEALKVEAAELTDVDIAARPGKRSTSKSVGTLIVEDELATLRYGDGTYHADMHRRLTNSGDEPITKFLVRIAVDRHPENTERSNVLYRQRPLMWDEINFQATCEEETLTWTVKHDRDAFKELYVNFESSTGRRLPLYPGQTMTLDYRYSVSDDLWGQWFQRAIRWPTRNLRVLMSFPVELRTVVWGIETSGSADRLPFNTPILERTEGDLSIFEWSTNNPPLHARYRLEWTFRR